MKSLSTTTGSIILNGDFDNRDDSEILSLLSQLRQQFNLLDLEKWVWIFEIW
jgi:hypothetical protein